PPGGGDHKSHRPGVTARGRPTRVEHRGTRALPGAKRGTALRPEGVRMSEETLGEVFRKAGRRFAGNVAIISQGEQRTFAEVIENGWRLTHALRARGLKPGAPVAA